MCFFASLCVRWHKCRRISLSCASIHKRTSPTRTRTRTDKYRYIYVYMYVCVVRHIYLRVRVSVCICVRASVCADHAVPPPPAVIGRRIYSDNVAKKTARAVTHFCNNPSVVARARVATRAENTQNICRGKTRPPAG